jgi:hypothetical protein
MGNLSAGKIIDIYQALKKKVKALNKSNELSV